MFEAYFDESFDGQGDIVWAVAGWVAPESAWQSFNSHWDEMLCKYCIPAFHASDCEGAHRDFKGWEDNIKNDLRNEALLIIEDAGLNGISAAINFREHPEKVTNNRDRYLYAIQYCLIEAFRKVPDGEKLRIVFGKTVNANGHVLALVSLLRHCQYYEAADKISSDPPKPDFARNVFGLQAADFLAYETYKNARSLLEGQQLERPFHVSLSLLTPTSQYFNGDDIDMLIEERNLLNGTTGEQIPH
jgi:uncharacterized protein DUF3800